MLQTAASPKSAEKAKAEAAPPSPALKEVTLIAMQAMRLYRQVSLTSKNILWVGK